jgi:hypothetical protein
MRSEEAGIEDMEGWKQGSLKMGVIEEGDASRTIAE